MKILSAVIVAVAILVVPGTAAAKSKDPDKRAAITQCKSERGKSKASRRAFKAKYHSFRGCTHPKVAKLKAAKAARRAAVGDCRDERSADDFPAAHEDKSFDEFYDSDDENETGFHECVATKVAEDEAADDDADEHGGKCDGDHESEHHDGGDDDSSGDD
jgi:hypothetical protein